ncbi:MAG: sel1 repeat family protein [Parachlamydiaceae bacterium]|nr:MAG: sel1 repeat family protein [Parachlamydiaceae bacterium]
MGLCHELGQGVPQNDSMAAHYYQQADSQKDALYRLALLYMTGRGVSQNVNTAISLLKDAIEIAAGDNKFEFQCLKLASDLGDAESTNNLGILYEQGNHEVIQNYQLAIEYYWKAAQRGFENAWYNLGHCFEEGTGVPQNFLLLNYATCKPLITMQQSWGSKIDGARPRSKCRCSRKYYVIDYCITSRKF